MTRHGLYLHNAAAHPLRAMTLIALTPTIGAGKLPLLPTDAHNPAKTVYHVTGHDAQNRRACLWQNQPKSEIPIA